MILSGPMALEEMEQELTLLRQNKKENDFWVDNQQSLIDQIGIQAE